MTLHGLDTINENLITQLEAIPAGLRNAWELEGFYAVDIFLKNTWAPLVDLIIRCDEFGLMLNQTHRFALSICNEILSYEIPVGEIFDVSDKLRRHFLPEHFFFRLPIEVLSVVPSAHKHKPERERGFTITLP